MTDLSKTALISLTYFDPRQHVSTIKALTKYASIFEAGLLSSKYPLPYSIVITGILEEAPLFPSPKVNLSMEAVSCFPVSL